MKYENSHKKLNLAAQNLIEQQLMVINQQLDLIEKTLRKNPVRSSEGQKLTIKSQENQENQISQNKDSKELIKILKTPEPPEEITVPVSPGQRNLWFLSSLGTDKSAAYHESVILRLRGELQLPLLKAALQTLVHRRDALRIISINGEEQTITSTLQVDIPYLDLSRESEPAKQEQLNIWLETAISEAFPLTQGPFFRLQVARLNQQDYMMVMVFHHIIADGLSIEVMVQEIAEFYSALCTQTVLHKPEPVSFQRYLDWLKTLPTSSQVQNDTAYWRSKLQDSIPNLTLPANPRSVRQYNGERQTATLDSRFYDKLKQFSQAQGVTVFMTLLAAWKVFLSRLTGQERLVVGIPTAGQVVSGAKDLVGHCSTVLPIVSNPVRELIFTEFLADLKKTLLDTYEHQSYFFTDGIGELDSQTLTIPQVLVTFNVDKVADIPTLHGLDAMLVPSPVYFTKYYLSFNGLQFKDKFILEFFYQTDSFDDRTIIHWCRSFVTLLQGIINAPKSRLYELPLISEQDKNSNVLPLASTIWDVEPLHKQFESQANRNPNATAIASGNESIVYEVLNHRANQLARYITAQETTARPVLLYVQHPIQLAIAILAIFKAGKSLALIQPGLSTTQMRAEMDKWAGSLLLTDSQLADSLPNHNNPLIVIDTDWQTISKNSKDNLNQNHKLDLWYSTTLPKANHLSLSYLALSRHIASLQKVLPLAAKEQVSILNGYRRVENFDILFHALSVGASLSVDTPDAYRHETNGVAIASLETFLPLVKAFQANPELLIGKKQRWIILDSGKVNYEQLKQITASLASSDSLVELYRVYKSPNVPLTNAIKQLTPLSNEQYERGSQPVSLGDPIGEMWFTVRDSYAQEQPVGVLGELYIEHPLWQQTGILIPTGEQACKLPDKSIEIHGCLDELIWVGATQMTLKEIEITLKLCPQVQEAVVVKNQSLDLTQKTELQIYITSTTNEIQVLQELENILKTLLPEPEIFVLMRVETIPRTPDGDIDYSALQEIKGVSLKQTSFVAPSNSTEQAIAQCVQQTLGKTAVGVHDNFFDLGLQSLQGVQLVSKIQSTLAVDVSLRDLFEAPTVASLAAQIRGRTTEPLPPIVPLQAPTDLSTAKPQFLDYELSPAQRGLWVHSQMDSSAIAYNLAMSLLLEGDLHVQALHSAFKALVARHESLRTTFVLVEDEPRQRVHDAVSIPYEFIDLTGNENPELQACEYSLQEAGKPFDLTQGPLLRLKLLKLSDAKYVLLFTIHHIIIDGWSLQIFEQELFHCYKAYKLGTEPQLPPLPIQYKDYAAWHNRLLQTDRVCKQRDYWLNKLSNAQPALNLPTDFPRSPTATFNGSVISLVFDSSLTAALNQLSRKYSASLYIMLVAIVKTLFYRMTQQNDIIVGASFADRPHPALEGQLGYFINTLVLRDAIAGHQSFLSILHLVRQTLLEAFDNALYPFDALVSELQQMEHIAHSSLFEVQVVLHNQPQTDTQREGLLVSVFQNIVLASKFDLIFNFTETNEQLQLDIEYKTDLWKPERIELMKQRLYALVVDIIASPEKKLDDLNIKTSQEETETELVFNLDF
ncbi:hypothetical protein NUACC21_69010 [Scytonema sp. NUACC21]